MMRDNRIMRTDRPGGNIRLFLCKMKKKKKEVENMKSKYRFRRILSGVMAAVTISKIRYKRANSQMMERIPAPFTP